LRCVCEKGPEGNVTKMRSFDRNEYTREDEFGTVTEYAYEGNKGENDKKYTDIVRDKNGKVTRFTTPDGDTFSGGKESPYWSGVNHPRGEKYRGLFTLGEVTIDKHGVRATGFDKDAIMRWVDRE
jgi:hypothetical protein